MSRNDANPSSRQPTDDRLHPSLPVTAEVGGEGGSFSDPTHQVATFENDVPRTDRKAVASSAAAPAEGRDRIAGDDVSPGPDPNHGMIRYPTEPPAPPSATEGLRMSGPNWRAGIIGGVAGAAAVLGLELLRRRKR